MSLIKRLSIVDKAVLTATGNSSCICGSSTEVLINTSDMITVTGTPTRDWTQAGSMAVLDILSNSTVLYAELLWYSTVVATFPGAVDVRSIQDNPITVIMPNGDIKSIAPDNGQDFVTFATGETVRFRSANVTSLINSYLGGNYTVSMIPTSIPPTGLNNSRCAWSLNVVYRNDSLPPKKIDFRSGIEYSTSTVPYQTTISGFTTSSNSNYLKGQMLLTVANGLPLSGNETVSIGPSLANLTVLGNPVGTPNANPLTAPNNPYNNFFAAQVNNCNPLSSSMGLIDIRGTNGSNNNNAFIPSQLVGARNKWDMTGIDISNTLVTDQTQLAFQLVSGQYSVQVMSIGTQIATVAPDVTVAFNVYDSEGDNINIAVGDTIVYTVTVNNNGEQATDNVILQLNPGSYASVVPNSLRVNNVITSGDIKTGVNIGTIGAYGKSVVKFEVSINSLPPVDKNGNHTITNSANYSYQFVSGIDTITNTGVSNSKTLNIEEGLLTLVKSVSSLTPTVGSTIVYTNVITNTGTQTLSNIVFQDPDTPYTTFVPNSVYINDVLTTGLDPTVGFSLSNLPVGAAVTIKYSIIVDSTPKTGIINTTSATKYSYVITGSVNVIFVTLNSNVVSLTIQYSQIMKTTCPNTNYPKIGDTVTYTTRLTNVGNMSASNVLVKDTPITGTSFIDGSVTVNGASMPGVNPYTGFTLSSPIAAGTTTIVTYNDLVNSLPAKEKIDNNATVPYQYIVTTEQGPITDTKVSNTVETLSYYVCMSMSETVDLSCATIGDTIYYTTTITNSGNISATNNLFTSNIQSDTTFVTGSVTINGVSYPSYNPINGFNIGTICAGNTAQVCFAVTVNSLPSGNLVYNNSNLSYNYLPNPTGNTIIESILSNTVETTINKTSYSALLSVDKSYAIVGDSIIFTAILNNTGSTELYDVSYYDYFPENLQFISGTVYVNGINYPTYNPTSGFNIPSLHSSDNSRVIYAAKVISNPISGYVIDKAAFTFSYQTCLNSPIITTTQYTNEIRIFIVNGHLSITKATDKPYAVLNDTVTYSFNVANTGNTPLSNVIFSDNLASSLQFIANSVIVNNVNKPDYNPITGFSLGNLNAGQNATISFKSAVTSVPNPNIIYNYGTGSYTFTIDPTQQPVTQSTNSNTVTTIVNKSDSTLTKQVDKPYATTNDILTYTLVAKNTGTVTLSNINITDILQSNLQFVTGSVIVNGISKPSFDPNSGFVIDNILANGSSTIVFQAKVISVPTNYTILNTGTMNYQYTLIPGGQSYNDSRRSNTVTTIVNTVSVTNTKTVDKVYATSESILTYTSIITNNSTISLNNTIFTDVVPFDSTFVTGSVLIDNVSYPSYNPQNGFTIGTFAPGQSIKVVFQVKVVKMPTVEVITNQSNINYSYQLYPDKPDVIYGNTLSNMVTTILRVGADDITKTADRTYARLNDIVTYKVVIDNSGNTNLFNVSFKDIIQSDSIFIEDSVYVDGIQKVGANPNVGFALSDLPIGSSTTVVFKVEVTSIPSPDGKLNNNATTTYSYYIDPTQNPITKSDTSNTTTVNVYDTIISTTKAVDKSFAKIGDTINYTVIVTNKGNVPAQSVVFTDPLDSNIQFVSQSVYIDGVQYTSYNPSTGFSLPDIAAGASVTVKFAATITKRPSDNTVYNSSTITYTYTIQGTTYNGTMKTNVVTTVVAYGELTITKSLDKVYGSLGDTINYTVIVKNTGSVNATALTFNDIIQNDALFNNGTVTIDDVSYSSYNPNNGFVLSDLVPAASHIISFNVKIVSVPSDGQINNAATTTFTYKLSDTDNPVTKTSTSNTVTTIVNLGKLTLTKSVDKSYATINDTVTYTINVSNIGNTVCSNVSFKDTIQSDASFITGSVSINNTSQSSYNPNTGFSLPDINPGMTIKVVFKVTINSVPSDQNLYNTSTTSYQYYSNPNSAPVITSSVSNTVVTVINIGKLNVIKSVDKSYATVGDTITYTVNINNVGTVNASAINFRDVLKTGVTFVTGSVTIGGVSYPAYNPYDSFTLGTLTPGQSVQVVFKTLVTSVPSPNVVSNIANIVFSYYIDPNGSIKTIQTDSNTVTTIINVASISLTKAVDKTYATANEILTYSFVLTNTGNVDLSNVTFVDNLQSDVTFNIGSVIVNGTSQPSYDPTLGFNLGTVATLSIINISFTVTVIAAPTSSSVIDSGLATFSYKINPSGETYTKTTQSNTVYTTLVIPSMSSNKTVDLAFVTIGNTLNYTITVKNTGNYLLTSVNFVDTLSNGGTFISGSVYIDGVNYSTYNPITGFSLPNLSPGNTTKVQFKANVSLVPTPPVITNYAISTAKCVITQTGTTIDVSTKSNTVSTTINYGSLTCAKIVDKSYARVGDTLTYTTTITNSGNVTATSLLFRDILQSELTFVSSSVVIGGVSYPSLNPNTGFSLSDLAAGNNITVAFNVTINALPIPPQVNNTSTTTFKYKIDPNGSDYSGTSTSNIVTTNVVKGQITAVKFVDKTIATLGDDLTYTITLTNTGNVAANSIIFTDTPTTGSTFKIGSVIINGTSQPTYDPTVGFSVPSIAIGAVTTIVFKATVTLVPSSNKVTNTASASFSYLVDPKEPPYSSTTTSNTVTTNIALGKLEVTKAVDKNYVTIGDKLTYTITVKNVGNINATNVQFVDPTPANTLFVTGSVTVNGTSYPSYNPEVSFNLGTITPGQTVTVVYQVQVVNLCGSN